MKVTKAFQKISLYCTPLFLMIFLIPFIKNDYTLTFIYFCFAFVYILISPSKLNILVYLVGLIAMTIFETVFLYMGVEEFTSQTLFGIMPLWLPFLWAYGFLVIKDSLLILLKVRL